MSNYSVQKSVLKIGSSIPNNFVSLNKVLGDSFLTLHVPYADDCCDNEGGRPVRTNSDGDLETYVDGAWIPVASYSGIISLTYNQIVAAAAADSLIPSALYQISDRGDLGLFFQAISVNQLAKEGQRMMLCPSVYTISTTDAYGNVWKGVWYSSATPAVGNLMIWGGLVWRNRTGSIGTAPTNLALDTTNWEVVAKASYTNNEYTVKVFDVTYDLITDWISEQKDTLGNVIGCSKTYWTASALGGNPCDLTDWNSGRMWDNKVWAVFNNAVVSTGTSFGKIYNNRNIGAIYKNIAQNAFGGAPIFNNTNQGHIYSNTNQGSVRYNSNLGSIYSNSNNGDIGWNFTTGNIFSNSNSGAILNNKLNNNGPSNYELSGNSNGGDISYNTCTTVYGNSNSGAIKFNVCGAIYLNANSGEITYNNNTGDIRSFVNTGSSYKITRNNFNGDMNGTGFTGITQNVDGGTAKTVTTTTYSLLPWDWNNIYTNVAGCTVTVPSGLGIPHSSIHTSTVAAQVTFTASGTTVSNTLGNTKSNGQYAPASLFALASNIFILGGDTAP